MTSNVWRELWCHRIFLKTREIRPLFLGFAISRTFSSFLAAGLYRWYLLSFCWIRAKFSNKMVCSREHISCVIHAGFIHLAFTKRIEGEIKCNKSIKIFENSEKRVISYTLLVVIIWQIKFLLSIKASNRYYSKTMFYRRLNSPVF